MNASVATKEDHVFLLTVTLAGDELAGFVSRARDMLAKELQVSGFRKGKVPKDMADKHLPDARVREAAMEMAIEDSFSRAVAEQGWDVAKTDGLNVTANEPGRLAYTVNVFVWPAVNIGDLSEVSVSRRPVEVTDEQVSEALETLRDMRATFLVKEGAVAEGDRAEVDFRSSIDGVPVPGGEGMNHPLIVGGRTFMPGFEEQLIGLRAGDRKEFELTAPEDYANAELAGKRIRFEVTVRTVQLVMRPEVNDDFARSLKLPDAGGLRDAVRQSVKAEQTVRERDRVRLAAMDAILGKTDIPAPAFLVAEERERMIRSFEQSLQEKGLGLDLYLARMNRTRADLQTQYSREAERQVRISLVLRCIIRDQRLEATGQEVDAMLQDTLSRVAGRDGSVPEGVDMDALRTTVADRIVSEKALAYLERTCVTAA
ncbi:MAG TPA: trigger factor [Candidatus Paceibacterota bacterium]|nr:trigger factor [Candidatus Paceibacterota bacterium]